MSKFDLRLPSPDVVVLLADGVAVAEMERSAAEGLAWRILNDFAHEVRRKAEPPKTEAIFNPEGAGAAAKALDVLLALIAQLDQQLSDLAKRGAQDGFQAKMIKEMWGGRIFSAKIALADAMLDSVERRPALDRTA